MLLSKSKIGSLFAACAATAVLLSGCTGGSSDDSSGGSDSGSFKGVPNSLTERLNSYAIHTTQNSTIDAHFFGISGVSSLSDTMEKGILAAIKSAGAFHGRRAFDPALTEPDEQWDASKFVEKAGQGPASSGGSTQGASGDSTAAGESTATSESTSSAASTGGSSKIQPAEISNSVVAAGGNFLVSRLQTTVGDTKTERVYVTDLSKNTTQSATALFNDTGKFTDDATGSLTVNDKALPVVGGNAVNASDLSDLGKQVRAAMSENLALPAATQTYNPDYSCGLLPCVAVTYDDGPATPEMTDELLGYLKTANVRATFFEIGQNVKTYPEAVKKILDMGNEVENHSWNHPQLSKLSVSALKKQVNDTDKAIESNGGKDVTMLRPPYGASNATVDKTVDKRIIQWDVDTLDWKTKNTQSTIKTGTTMSEPGSIILMHSIHEPTIKAAPQLLKNLKAKGLYPVTVGQLFKGLPFEAHGEYYCRGYRTELCSNPEHPMVEKGKAMAKAED